MNLNDLQDVFNNQLKDIYSAEKQLTEALPEMARAAHSPKLQQAFEKHLSETHRHLETVHGVLERLGVNPGNTKCEAMEGLLEEGSEMAKKKGDPVARDAGIICAAQKVEHYEIATYGSLRSWAEVLGDQQTADTLQEILNEEYDANIKLDQLAMEHINQQAAS